MPQQFLDYGRSLGELKWKVRAVAVAGQPIPEMWAWFERCLKPVIAASTRANFFLAFPKRIN